jgi:hypothetical protein
METAKRQAQQIATIGGRVPRIYIAVQAHFANGRLSVDWQDPPRDKEVKSNLDISDEELTDAYYRPIERMLEERADLVEVVRIGERIFDTVRVPDADLRIGLQQDVRGGVIRRLLPRRRVTLPEERATEGADGVLVQLGESWDVANMQREPQERSSGVHR